MQDYNFIIHDLVTYGRYLECCTQTLIWAASSKKHFRGICRQERARSDCAFAQSEQGLHFTFTDLLDTVKDIDA